MNTPKVSQKIEDVKEKNSFEALLSIFVSFVEEEARRIDEERHGLRRRDGGRVMQSSIFLTQLRRHIWNSAIEEVGKVLPERQYYFDPVSKKKMSDSTTKSFNSALDQSRTAISKLLIK